MSEFDDVSNVYLGWISSILKKAQGYESKDISSFGDLSDGDAITHICTALNLPLKRSGKEIFEELRQFFQSAKIDCNFEPIKATEGDEATLMDIIWTLVLHFSVCRGQDVDPDDKCIELGRCLLIEWLQIVCPSVGVLDADKELNVYFFGNDLLIKVVESVFSTKLTLPGGNLCKQIFCTLLLVEEAFGVSKNIIDAKSLAEGNCPEFALIIYLSLLKSFYLGDFSRSHNSSHASEIFHRPSFTHSVIHEQPSQEDLEESLSSSSGIGTSCTDKIDDRDKFEDNFNFNVLQNYHSPSKHESGIHSSSNCNSQLDIKSLEACNVSLQTHLKSNSVASSSKHLDNNFACSTPRISVSESGEDPSAVKTGVQTSDRAISSNHSEVLGSSFLGASRESAPPTSRTEDIAVITHNVPSHFIAESVRAPVASSPMRSADVTLQDNSKPSVMNTNDTKNTTDLQVTVIEQNRAENSSIDTIRLREILDRAELGSSHKEQNTEIEISNADNHINNSQTSVEIQSFLQRDDAELIMEPMTNVLQHEINDKYFQPMKRTSEFCGNSYPNEDNTCFGNVLSPPQDPLMRLLENIADKGQCLRDALDLSQNQLDSGTHSSHNNSFTFGKEGSCSTNPAVIELEKRVDELSENNYTLSLQFKDMTRKLDHEIQKSARLVKEIERLEMINRSFREENLKQEEKVIFLENSLLQKDNQAIKERIELRAQKEAIEKKLKFLPLAENLIDVDEKDATIIGLQHEVEEIIFEKQKVELELEHTREIMKQKEVRQRKEETEREAEMNRLKNKNSVDDVMSVDRLAEMSSTICTLENALSTSEKRNNELSNKLDNLTFNQTSNYCYEPLNRSLQTVENNSHELDLNLSCPSVFNSRDRVAESGFRLPPVFVNGYSLSPSYNKFDPLPLIIPHTPPIIPPPSLSQPPNFSHPNNTAGLVTQHEPWLRTQPIFGSQPVKNRCIEIGLQAPNLSSAEMSSICQNCKNVIQAKPATVELSSSENPQARAFGDVPSIVPESKKSSSAYVQTTNPAPTVTFNNNLASNEGQSSKNGLSQSSRELIDQILAKYSSAGTKIVHEPPEKRPQISMLPSNDRGTSSQVLTSEAVKVSKPYKSSDDVSAKDGNGVRDINYNSLREATQSITKQILSSDNEFSKPVEHKNSGLVPTNDSSDSVKIKTFEQFLQSKANSRSEVVPSDSATGSNSAEANLKPFLSRTLATNDVFLQDGNTDLKNKHILSSVQTPDAKALPSSFYPEEIYRSITAHTEIVAPNNQKFSALFSSMNSDSGMSSESFDVPKVSREPRKDFNATSVIAEMGQRLRDRLKNADNVSTTGEISGVGSDSINYRTAHAQIPGFEANELAIKYVPHNRVSNIEDEIITRYKKELRLVDTNEDLSETVTKDIHASIMKNLRNRNSGKDDNSISSSEASSVEKYNQEKFVLPAEKPGNLGTGVNYSHHNAVSYNTANGAVSTNSLTLVTETAKVEAPRSSNATSVGSYLKTLDEKYGAVNQNIKLPKHEEPLANETKAKQNFLRSSTPTQQIQNVPNQPMTHPPPPAIDVSHISLAAASSTNHISSRPIVDHSVYNQHHAVQFYPIRNFQDVSSMMGSSGFTH